MMSGRIRIATVLIGTLELVKGIIGSYIFFLCLAYLYYSATLLSGNISTELLSIICCALLPFPILLISVPGIISHSNFSRLTVLFINCSVLLAILLYAAVLFTHMHKGVSVQTPLALTGALAIFTISPIIALNLPAVKRDYR